MALGKNLKKQQLIPTSVEKPSTPKEVVPVSDESRKTSINEDKKQFLTEAEYQRREQLKIKYAKDIEAFQDQRIHLIVFQLQNEEYAVQIEKVQEVAATPSMSKLPHTPPYVKGVVNIRGELIVAVDLAQKFGLRKQEAEVKSQEETTPFIMVLENEEFNAGLLIEAVPSTLIIDGNDIGLPSGMITDVTMDETFIKGLAKLENRIIFLVDVDELLLSDKASVSSENILANE